MLESQLLSWLSWLAMAALMLACLRRPIVRPRIEVEVIATGRPRR